MSSKKIAMIGILVVLLLGGGAFGVYTMKMNAASYRAMVLPVNGQPKEICKEWESTLQEIVENDEFLKWAVEKSNYASVMEIPEDQAVEDLKDRVEVRYKQQRKRIEIGLTGKRKEDEKLNQIAKVLHEGAIGTLAKNDSSFESFLKSTISQ